MADRILLADIPRNGRERVRISVAKYRGTRFADIRIYGTAADGALVPTNQGLTLRPDTLRRTIEALEAAERKFIANASLPAAGRPQ